MVQSSLQRKIKKALFGLRYAAPSFSQAGEDMILRNLLRKIENGFYVDIGAYHPVLSSNTHYFNRFENWSGINVEPNPAQIGFFRKARPNDVNLNVGVSAQKAKLNYYVLKDLPMMNSFSLDFIKKAGKEDAIEKIIEVETLPLEAILDEYLPENKAIDLLNVDVEGLDTEVLESNDWNKYRPKSIVIEIDINGFETNSVNRFLLDAGYVLVGMTPVNTQVVMSCVYFDGELYKTFENY